jgi:hypothetical protein
MKTKWMLSLILTVPLFAGCQKSLRVSAPVPGSQAPDHSQQSVAENCNDEPKDKESRRAEVA